MKLQNKPIEYLIKDKYLLSMSLEDWNNSMLSSWGKTLYKNIIKVLKAKIEAYDKSSEINSFIYNNKEYWFDKNTRASLLALASCSEEPITLVLGDELVEVDADKVKKFISDLEIYASKCYVNTAKHLNSIKDLKTVEDVINYNYTSGYPNRLYLTLDLI